MEVAIPGYFTLLYFDDTGYMPIHGNCLVKHNAKKLNYSKNWRLVPATLTPPVISKFLSLDDVPNTTTTTLSLRWVQL